MGKDHLKRQTVPKQWAIRRKAQKFILRPKPGRPFQLAMPLGHIMRELLGKARTMKESRFLLRHHNVTVNGKRVHDHRRPVGFMDVVGFPDIKEYYRITLSPRGRLSAVKTTKPDMRLAKVRGKSRIAGKIQVNCKDGSNFLLDKDAHSTGDSLVIKDGAVSGSLPLEKGATIMLTGGSHLAMTGKVSDIDGKTIEFENDKGSFTTKKRFAFVVNDEVLA